MPNEPKTFFLKIYGCLFNYADAERLRKVLLMNKFSEVGKPEEADILILVTCSVREKAEHKALAWGQKIKAFKKKPIVVLTGCMVRRDYLPDKFDRTEKRIKTLAKKFPWIDIFMDITNMVHLPEVIKEFSQLPNLPNVKPRENLKFKLALTRKSPVEYHTISPAYSQGVFAYIPIMSGCDQMCTYCIVPHSRGKEVYRPYEDIIKDIREALAHDKKILILLGQIIDKWHDQNVQKDFADLLEDIAKISTQDYFVGFTSPHPSYITEKTLKIIANNEKIFKHLGLPLQSGSNRVLKAMNRPYTREEFIKKALLARKTIPNLYLTTDVIVGYPPENEEDFEQTLDIIQKLRFDKVFFAKYSPRFDTRDAKIIHDLKYQESVADRFDRLNALTQKIFIEQNKKQIGKIFKAVYLGNKQVITQRYQLVDIQSLPSNIAPGDFVRVKVLDAGRRGLVGEVISSGK